MLGWRQTTRSGLPCAPVIGAQAVSRLRASAKASNCGPKVSTGPGTIQESCRFSQAGDEVRVLPAHVCDSSSGIVVAAMNDKMSAIAACASL